VDPFLTSTEVTRADELFVNLDRSNVDTQDGSWRIEVCGIHTHGSRSWIQLNLWAEACYGLTLRIDNLDAPRVREMLGEWLSSASMTVGSRQLISAAASA
jgi:hypothetical protein